MGVELQGASELALDLEGLLSKVSVGQFGGWKGLSAHPPPAWTTTHPRQGLPQPPSILLSSEFELSVQRRSQKGRSVGARFPQVIGAEPSLGPETCNSQPSAHPVTLRVPIRNRSSGDPPPHPCSLSCFLSHLGGATEVCYPSPGEASVGLHPQLWKE